MGPAAPKPHIRIRPPTGWPTLDVGTLFRYRDLLFFFIKRDWSLKYNQAVLGILWAVIVPVVNMLVFGVVFGRIARMPTDGINPFLFFFSALVAWHYFSGALSSASMSLVTNGSLLTKVYFPRLLMPLGSTLSGVVDFGVAYIVLVLTCLLSRVEIGVEVLLAPVWLLPAVLTALGAGLILAPLYLQFRDMKFIQPFLLQLWMFATVVVPLSRIPEPWRDLYVLNPMVGVVSGIRWSLFSSESAPPVGVFFKGAAVAVALVAIGLVTFTRRESRFADDV